MSLQVYFNYDHDGVEIPGCSGRMIVCDYPECETAREVSEFGAWLECRRFLPEWLFASAGTHFCPEHRESDHARQVARDRSALLAYQESREAS